MRLQLALDTVDLKGARELLDATQGLVDIVEDGVIYLAVILEVMVETATGVDASGMIKIHHPHDVLGYCTYRAKVGERCQSLG